MHFNHVRLAIYIGAGYAGRLPGGLSLSMASSPTQAEIVRRGIERDIFRGALLPGTALEEGRIAADYGVSRTPVREAIANLAQAGLLSKPARRRAVVAELDSGRLLEMFEALAELEGRAARLAALRMSPEQKAALGALHQQAAAALREGSDPNAYAELGARFHQAVLEGCRNRVLIEMTAALALRVHPYRRYQVVAPGRLELNQADHDRVVSAILAGDAEGAAAAMRAHTSEQGDALMRFIALHKVSYTDLRASAGAPDTLEVTP